MPSIKVHVFHTGLVKVDQAVPLKDKNPIAFTGIFRSKKKSMKLPVSSYLIESEKGRILIDTGWDSKWIKEKPKRFMGMLNKMSAPIIKEGESVLDHLHALGLEAKDIDCVYYSHLDFDHTSGTTLVRDAKRFMASEEEIKDAKEHSFRYQKDDWSMINLESFSYENSGIGPVGRSYDIYKDGTILLVSTPGHTHGHFSVLVKGSNGYLIIAGDAAYIPDSYQKRIIPGFTVDRELAFKSLDWLIEARQDPDCLGVFANHDPSIEEQVVEVEI